MVSRLDRLFILLDTGSNESIRLAAAKQLGEVQRFQPNDLNYLLRRIKEYSSKTVWETRVASGHAIRCVLEHVDPWPPKKPVTSSSKDDNTTRLEELARNVIEQNAQFSSLIEQFDLDKIINLCPKLFSLDISDTEYQDSIDSTSSKRKTRGRGGGRREGLARCNSEQLMRQRKFINKELGIAMVDRLNIGVKSTDIVSNDDLQDEYSLTDPSVLKSASTQQQNAKAILIDSISNYDKVLAALCCQGCISNSSSDSSIMSNSTPSNVPKDGGISKVNTDSWPLTDIVKQFSDDLFNPSWETRHGAAIALREIIKRQGQSAGRRPEIDDASNSMLNQVWLVDMALRALSVLALDRFGDFLFDQVVAPVRENTAQLLGHCVAHLEKETAIKILLLTTRLLENDNWETRHGGILGLKYSLNVFHQILTADVFQECFQKIFKCLSDPIDDVSAEAAATLVPLKDLLIKLIPDEVPKLTKFLWEYLAGLDELSTSTGNIVLLLASLITSKSVQLEPSELSKSIPKLWYLLGHSSSSVRMSVFRALITLLNHQKDNFLAWAGSGPFCNLIPDALRLVYQRSVIENQNEVRPLVEEVWRLLIRVDSNDESHSRCLRLKLLEHTSKYLNYWLCLVMQPSNLPIDRSPPMWLHVNSDGSECKSKPDGEIYIGSCTFNAESADHQRIQVMECRMLGTRLLGALYANLVNDFSNSEESRHAKESSRYISDMFTHYLKTKSANQRIISGWAVESWANHQNELLSGDIEKLGTILSENLVNQVTIDLQETSLCYDELASTFTRLQQETRDFVATLRSANISLDLLSSTDKRAIYNLNQIKQLCDLNIESELTRIASKRPHDDNPKTSLPRHDITRSGAYITLSTKKLNLTKSLKSTISEQKALSTSVLSSLACASIAWRLPMPKLDLIANPLLDSVEIEEEPTLQDKSIRYLVKLFDILCENPEQNAQVMESFLKRLTDILSYKELSLIFESESENHLNNVPNSADTIKKSELDSYRIILLDSLQRRAELGRSFSRRQSSMTSTSNLKRSQSLTSSSLEGDTNSDLVANSDDATRVVSQNSKLVDGLDIKYRGASLALSKLVEHFAEELPMKLPQFWQSITSDVKSQIHLSQSSSAGGEAVDRSVAEVRLIKNLRLLEVVGGSLSIKLRKHLLDLFPDLIEILSSANPLIRHHGAQCIGVISKLDFPGTIEMIKKRIIPMLDENDNISARCGSIEAVALVIERLQLDLVPRINMFIIQVLRRMSDQNDQVRLMATHCFGKLLSLMPLNLKGNNETGQPNSSISRDSIKAEKTDPAELEDQGKFIDQLLNPKKLDYFEIPFAMDTELRTYQRDGLHWLAFLNRYNLHGILCDEMGLGKTFMTICMVASNHHNLSRNLEKSSPSLIVCPPTLTEHWLGEIEKFLPADTKSMLNSITYTGHINDRMGLRSKILRGSSVQVKCEKNNSQDGAKANNPITNLVITSYDIVRNDIEFFRSIHWNYCVLDEGHIIKNGKTKLSKSIRLLTAKHRLILTGTPIQNNVTELWSLFDFLMPGFLGSERQFNCRYAKPIIQSRELKCSPRELEAGVLAMESLHRQVLPFILRRLKEDVLDDLPPKIIQDYYCELSPLQYKLYEDFTRSKLCQDVTKKSVQSLNDQSEEANQQTGYSSKNHVFQALQYLKNVCNHPKLVLTEKHSQYSEIKKSLDAERSSLDDVAHSSKLKALKQLLIDCGIGAANQSGDDSQQQQPQQNLDLQSVVNQHRALVFCQIRTLVNIIEEDLLKKHFPTVTYLKLDGSVPTNRRQSIVSRFNNDPSIDLLLLTTSIGGLGLNLTGADTVIFVEHDWNPTKDLQAMDRAHRIGQRKVVNVYRLITKGTLEEKIMGLQKFKTMVSKTVINQDNTGLGTMNVDQLFDLFNDVGNNSTELGRGSAAGGRSGAGGDKSFVDLLPELWDQQQYETEYDLSNFVSSLKS